MKRILLDQGLAPHAAAILRRKGLDAVHVSEIGMERAEDIEIIEKARIEERVCVTLDHDFHAHLAMTGNGRPSVVLLQCPGTCSFKGRPTFIRLVYTQCEAALSEGAPESQRMAKDPHPATAASIAAGPLS